MERRQDYNLSSSTPLFDIFISRFNSLNSRDLSDYELIDTKLDIMNSQVEESFDHCQLPKSSSNILNFMIARSHLLTSILSDVLSKEFGVCKIRGGILQKSFTQMYTILDDMLSLLSSEVLKLRKENRKQMKDTQMIVKSELGLLNKKNGELQVKIFRLMKERDSSVQLSKKMRSKIINMQHKINW